jgi:hypothetical protein
VKPSKRYSKKNTPDMLERPVAHSNRADAELNREPRKVLTLRPMVDREVPLPGATSEIGDMPMAVQQWLDGDIAERHARRADDEAVEFWNRIQTETSRRGRMETPSLMSERIMAVLPKKQPSRAAALLRPFSVNLVTVLMCGAALLVTGIVVGEWLLH